MTARLRSIELFAGAGGLALGAEQAGFEPVVLVEFDPASCSTLLANRPRWPVLREQDVRDVDFRFFRGIDLVSGGPPCQPFSSAGRRKLQRDSRDMFPEALRAVEEALPRAVLLENVSGLLEGDARPYFDDVRARLSGMGYDVSARLLNCADYGVPQRRERVFILGFRRDIGAKWSWPAATHSIAALAHSQYVTGEYWREHGLPRVEEPPRFVARMPQAGWMRKRWRTVRDAVRGLDPSEAKHRRAARGGRFFPHAWDEPAFTVTTMWSGAILEDTPGWFRFLDIPEAARLQTFPDDWQFAGSPDDQLHQIGNAVPVEMARVLTTAIAVTLDAASTLAAAA